MTSMEDADWSSATPFVLPITECKVIKVYDGDTITGAFTLSGDPMLYRIGIRLNGIDCPELHPRRPDSPEKSAEIECALMAKQCVSDLVLGKIVQLSNNGHDKYGRLLANVHVDGVDISEILIAKRLAVPYGGQTKVCPDNWTTFHEEAW